MSELPKNKEAGKLDWMYRDASQIVDREEYLLGRKIDKQLETSLLPPDKDQECLPPSIFSRGATECQVDSARKLQEDPLYLIKKKEIECREQLLKNPRKMKQLQEMIARQQAAAEKLKMKQMKKRKKKELDALLLKKCKSIFGRDGTKKLAELDNSDSETSSSDDTDVKKEARMSKKKKKKKKKNERKDLDMVLALKYKKMLGNMDVKGLAEMDCTSESSSEDESEKKVRRKKEKQPSSSSDERQKWDLKTNTRKERERGRKYHSSEDESKSGNEYKNSKRDHYNAKKGLSVDVKRKDEGRSRNQSRRDNRSKQRGRSSSSEDTDNAYNKNQLSKVKRSLDEDRFEERRNESRQRFNTKYNNRYSEREQFSGRSHEKNRSEGKESTERGLISLNHKSTMSTKKSHKDGARYCVKKETSARSSSESSSYDTKKIIRKGKPQDKKDIQSDSSSGFETKKTKPSKSLKQDVSKRKKESSTSSSPESSSEERRRQPKKQYGLVLPANYVPKKQTKEEKEMKPANKKDEESSKTYRRDKVKLTEEEKERKLKEMMVNAKWRDEQRDKNIKAFKEKEKAEKDDYVYNEDFMRKQMALAVNQGSVEARVKANINTIQRSGASMSEHFARRK